MGLLRGLGKALVITGKVTGKAAELAYNQTPYAKRKAEEAEDERQFAARQAEEANRRAQEEAFWNSPEGHRVRAAQAIAEIEKKKEEAFAKIRAEEAEKAARIANEVAEKSDARQRKMLARQQEMFSGVAKLPK